MEVREEDAIHGERVEAGAQHTSHGSRAEVEHECLPTGFDCDTTLPPIEAGDYRARTDDRDLHALFPS
jgi:hypothetical protein